MVLKQMLHSKDHAAFIAIYEGDVIGVQWVLIGPDASFDVEPFGVQVKLTSSEGYLYDLRVKKEYRSFGVMPLMQHAVSQWLIKKGIRHVYSDVLAANGTAISSMEKMGFTKFEKVTLASSEPGRTASRAASMACAFAL